MAALAVGAAAAAATLSRSRRWVSAAASKPASASRQPTDLFDDLAAAAARLPRWASVGPTALRRAQTLRRHPWRFALSVAAAAGLVVAAGHGLSEGGPNLRHLPWELIGGLLIASIEAGLTLLGFAVLGRFLGIRGPGGVEDWGETHT